MSQRRSIETISGGSPKGLSTEATGDPKKADQCTPFFLRCGRYGVLCYEPGNRQGIRLRLEPRGAHTSEEAPILAVGLRRSNGKQLEDRGLGLLLASYWLS